MRTHLDFYWLIVKSGWDFVGRISDHWSHVVFVVVLLALVAGGTASALDHHIAALRWLFWPAFGLVVAGFFFEGAYQAARVKAMTGAASSGLAQDVFAGARRDIAAFPVGTPARIETTRVSAGEQITQTITFGSQTLADAPQKPRRRPRRAAAPAGPEADQK